MKCVLPHSSFAALSVVVLLPLGCDGRPDRVDQPDYARGAGSAAVDAYDANDDGAISGDELDRVPGLRESLAQVDADGDGRLTADEIDAHVQRWRDTKTARMPVDCQVTLDGEPLAGASIQFEPEPFLGSAVLPGSGTTGDGGSALISMADEHLGDLPIPGMACGWYKVRVTSRDRQIPPRYNAQTTLGCEVAPNAYWIYDDVGLVFELTSKPSS
jgi:hypothetical protein